MIIVKDDNPDVRYAVNPGQVTDAEGHPVPSPALLIEVSSSDATVVSIAADAGDALHGSAHFGAPGQATVTANIKRASDGLLLGAFDESFTVTVGDPATIQGGTITFEGLTPA